MQAAHTGRVGDAHRLAARALDSGRLTPRVRAPFRLRQARAYAVSGRRREALDAVDHARSLFADGPSRRDPHWTWWLDDWELVGHHGWTYAALRDWDRAIPLLHRATEAPRAPSYRMLFTAELLSALVHAGAWRDAEELMARLLPEAAGIGSARAVRSILRTAAAVESRHGAPRAPRYVRDTAHVFTARTLGG